MTSAIDEEHFGMGTHAKAVPHAPESARTPEHLRHASAGSRQATTRSQSDQKWIQQPFLQPALCGTQVRRSQLNRLVAVVLQ
jgi:hypothetical protein